MRPDVQQEAPLCSEPRRRRGHAAGHRWLHCVPSSRGGNVRSLLHGPRRVTPSRADCAFFRSGGHRQTQGSRGDGVSCFSFSSKTGLAGGSVLTALGRALPVPARRRAAPGAKRRLGYGDRGANPATGACPCSSAKIKKTLRLGIVSFRLWLQVSRWL